jgi:hypothetical protein
MGTMLSTTYRAKRQYLLENTGFWLYTLTCTLIFLIVLPETFVCEFTDERLPFTEIFKASIPDIVPSIWDSIGEYFSSPPPTPPTTTPPPPTPPTTTPPPPTPPFRKPTPPPLTPYSIFFQ